jgi:N utilization substance protein B
MTRSTAKPRPDAFARSLLRGVTEELRRHRRTDREAMPRTGSLERMPAVDRNVLRLAVYEMLRTDTPAAIVIDEALELARRFAGEESVQFVNGVLDAVRKELPAKIPLAAGARGPIPPA